MTELTEAEIERLNGIIRWHGRAHAEDPDGSYLSLATENVRLYVEKCIDARLAPIRALHTFKAAVFAPHMLTDVVLREDLDAALSADLTAPQPTSGTEGQDEAR